MVKIRGNAGRARMHTCDLTKRTSRSTGIIGAKAPPGAAHSGAVVRHSAPPQALGSTRAPAPHSASENSTL
jgi:hypothetical protein